MASIVGLAFYYNIYVVNIGSKSSPEKEFGVFRVMTLNFNASGPDTLTSYRRDSLISLIGSVSPDILCTQEISIASFIKLQAGLDSILGYNEKQGGNKENYRIHFYSKFPLKNFTYYSCVGDIDTTGFSVHNYEELNSYKTSMSAYSIDMNLPDGRDLTMITLHLRSSAYSTARRSLEGKPWMEGFPLYIQNYLIGKRIRDYQAENLRHHVDSLKALGRTVMIAGDFNDWNGSDCLDIIQGDDLKDAWIEGGNGFGFTYAGWNLRLRLDHILYPERFMLENVYVLNSDISDHRALIADFKLKD